MNSGHQACESLGSVRRGLQRLGDPVILFNKSHSGSRLLADLVSEAGFFLGAHQNEAHDSLDVLDLVSYLVETYYPDYSPLWDGRASGDMGLPGLVRDVFERHLHGRRRGRPWGWKLGETAFALPVVDHLFPKARYVHLIRDGRDVAFSDHEAPVKDLWRKVYFNTDRIRSWNRLPLTLKGYRRRPHVYNAVHWANSVLVGRSCGMMLRDRYLEVRYEDLCLDFERTAVRVLRFLGASRPLSAAARVAPRVRTDRVHKFRGRSPRKLRQVMDVIKPLMLSLGYVDTDD